MRSWNSRRALGAAAFGMALLVIAGSALGAGGKRPAKAKVLIQGGPSFKPNGYIKDAVHFGAGTVIIRSGGQVTLTNTTGDPHTLSIVTASQLPRTLHQVENCTVCGAIAKSHGVNFEGPPPSSGPPPIPLVNVGGVGFDKPGDSVLIGPKGHGGQVSFKVTARPGTTLRFMCIIHPWMQGRFLVK
jgi:plastocyanin